MMSLNNLFWSTISEMTLLKNPFSDFAKIIFSFNYHKGLDASDHVSAYGTIFEIIVSPG